MAQYEIKYLNADDTWMHIADIVDDGLWRRYIRSFFWVTGSMVTVVSFFPQNSLETVIFTITLVLNTGVFGYSVNIRKKHNINSWRYFK